MFEYDATGIDPKEIEGPSFDPVPQGDYQLQVLECEERMSSNGNQMVIAKCEIQNKDYLGRFVWHNVVFLPEGRSGRGMALKFLKMLKLPYEGKFNVKPEEWEGKLFDAHLTVETYQGKARNKIAYVMDKTSEESVPF